MTYKVRNLLKADEDLARLAKSELLTGIMTTNDMFIEFAVTSLQTTVN